MKRSPISWFQTLDLEEDKFYQTAQERKLAMSKLHLSVHCIPHKSKKKKKQQQQTQTTHPHTQTHTTNT